MISSEQNTFDRNFECLSARQMSKINDACDLFDNELVNANPFVPAKLMQTHLSSITLTEASSEPLFEVMLFRSLLQTELAYMQSRSLLPTKTIYSNLFVDFLPEIEAAFSSKASAENYPSEASRTATPTRIGEYEILEVLGRGGMGTVYKAHQKQLNRIVALKTIRSGEFASEDQIERFEAEASALAKLQHPGIVPIFEFGKKDGKHFFSMAYVEGDTLSDLVNDQPIPGEQAAKLMVSVAQAVGHAHGNNILHRDLKPANILLDQDGAPKVTDFGLVKFTDSNTELTETGQLLGTPAYMSPEQVAGNTEEIDLTSDIYSLGGTLYCLLTGRPPFQSASKIDLLLSVASREPVSPCQLNPGIDIDLETICLKCLRKSPADRYQTTSELADDLTRYLAKKPILARPISMLERTKKFILRSPAISVLLAIVTATILLLLIGGTVYQWRLTSALEFANLEREKAANSEAEKTGVLYDALIAQAGFLNQTRPIGYGDQVWKSLDQALKLQTPKLDRFQLRQLAVSAMGRSTFQKPKVLTGLNATISSAIATPTGDQALVGLGTGEVVVFDTETNNEIQRLAQIKKPILGFRFPDDNTLLTSISLCRKIHRWKRAGASWKYFGEIETNLRNDQLPIRMSPSGRTLIGATHADSVLPVDQFRWTEAPDLKVDFSKPSNATFFVKSLEDLDQPVEDTGVKFSNAFAINEPYLAVAYSAHLQGDDSIIIYDLEAKKVKCKFDAPIEARSIVIDEQKKHIAIGGHTGTCIFDIETGKLVSKLTDKHGEVRQFVDGARALATKEREKNVLYSLAKNNPIMEATSGNSGFDDLRYSNGYRFEYSPLRNKLSLVNARSKECKSWNSEAKSNPDVSFHPNGESVLCFGAGHERVQLRDVEDGEVIWDTRGQRATFHPSGKMIAVKTSAAVELRALPENKIICSIDDQMHFNRIRFNGDGSLLYGFGWREGQLKVYRLDGGKGEHEGGYALTEILDDPNGFRSAAWCCKSSHLASVVLNPQNPPYGIRIRNRNGSWEKGASGNQDDNKLLGCGSLAGAFCSVVFPEKDRICCMTTTEAKGRRVQLWDTQKNVMICESSETLQHPMCASPDGKLLSCRQKIVDAKTLEVLFELPSFAADPWGVDWSSDGTKIAFGYVGGDIAVWDLAAVGRRLNQIGLTCERVPCMRQP